MSFEFFHTTVTGSSDLSPSFRRFTFAGASLKEFADPGWDQRIKLVLPLPDSGYGFLPRGQDWYQQWRTLPPQHQNPFRTYTVRRVADSEVEVDMVVHPVDGPASAWIATAQPGDDVMLLGPTTTADCAYDFVPPAQTGSYLLAGDETAAPAIAVILEQLPPSATGIAVIEVPQTGDAVYLPTHPGIDVRVFGRDGSPHGTWLDRGTRLAAEHIVPPGRAHEVSEIDVDTELLWEVPRNAKGGAALASTTLYAWLAGEAAVIKTLRRHLVGELGLDRRTVAFMGYWRLGRAES